MGVCVLEDLSCVESAVEPQLPPVLPADDACVFLLAGVCDHVPLECR